MDLFRRQITYHNKPSVPHYTFWLFVQSKYRSCFGCVEMPGGLTELKFDKQAIRVDSDGAFSVYAIDLGHKLGA